MSNNEMIFQEVAGVWRRVDSQKPHPQTLADTLEELHIIIDDDTRFCRIIRYIDSRKYTITYRADGGKITIDIHGEIYNNLLDTYRRTNSPSTRERTSA